MPKTSRSTGPKSFKRQKREKNLTSRSSRFAVELKNNDRAIDVQIDASAEIPQNGQMCFIPQGVADNERIGRKLVIKSFQLRGTLQMGGGVANTSGSVPVYMYVIQDRQTNGAVATPSQVLTGADFSTALVNLDNKRRFRIIKRMVFTIERAVTNANAIQVVDYFTTLDIPVEYSGSSGELSEQTTNNLFLMFGTGPSLAFDDTITFKGNTRIRYLD